MLHRVLLRNLQVGRGRFVKAFTGGFSAFEQAVQRHSEVTKKKEIIFGPNTNIWYNAEVMDPRYRR